MVPSVSFQFFCIDDRFRLSQSLVETFVLKLYFVILIVLPTIALGERKSRAHRDIVPAVHSVCELFQESLVLELDFKAFCVITLPKGGGMKTVRSSIESGLDMYKAILVLEPIPFDLFKSHQSAGGDDLSIHGNYFIED
jgi:hypothetical protein